MAVELRWGERTYVMGIVNLTPDSFSGDGLVRSERSADEIMAAALDLARAHVDAGAEIIDVGAESSRPRAAYGEHPDVDEATELALAIPVVRAIVRELGDRALVSIDTTKGAVARAAVEAGAGMVNDVSGGRTDPGTADAAAAGDAHLVLMHNQEGVDYPDGVVETVIDRLRRAI
ncbi:MAG: dihydropteroate synthase, partial [Chloroflexi bacterium]|nr:dihydropteroate synthase [Chloroflexota bacterium]